MGWERDGVMGDVPVQEGSISIGSPPVLEMGDGSFVVGVALFIPAETTASNA